MSDNAKALIAVTTLSLAAIGLMWFIYFRFHVRVRPGLWTALIVAIVWVFDMGILVWLDRRRKSAKADRPGSHPVASR